jgi:two-component system sensor histidine kinase KdpD
MPKLSARNLIRAVRLAAGLVLVAATTWIAFAEVHANALIAGFAYMLIVLIVAARWGLIESLLTSVAAVLCLNYFFLPPVGSLTIADPLNWVALFAFMMTAVTASQLSASARSRAAEAQARRAEVEQLYQVSLSLLRMDAARSPGLQIAEKLKEQLGFESVLFCDSSSGEVSTAGDERKLIPLDALRSAAKGDAVWRTIRTAAADSAELDSAELVIFPVAFGTTLLGSICTVGASLSDRALQALANLAASALEHSRQQIALGRLEVARENERLRGVLLDALAHEFLTPLTSIKSAISTVRAEYSHDEEESEFLAVIEEESDKLGEMINETTDMARIEPGHPRIRRRRTHVATLIRSGAQHLKNLLGGRPLLINIPEGIPEVEADPELVELAIRQLIGNAIKYSPPETAIEVRAACAEGLIEVEVRDHGAGVPDDELDSIFDRFYRGKKVKEAIAGTGMGLSIARDIVEAHGGAMWAANAAEGGGCFFLTLPVALAENIHEEPEHSDCR